MCTRVHTWLRWLITVTPCTFSVCHAGTTRSRVRPTHCLTHAPSCVHRHAPVASHTLRQVIRSVTAGVHAESLSHSWVAVPEGAVHLSTASPCGRALLLSARRWSRWARGRPPPLLRARPHAWLQPGLGLRPGPHWPQTSACPLGAVSCSSHNGSLLASTTPGIPLSCHRAFAHAFLSAREALSSPLGSRGSLGPSQPLLGSRDCAEGCPVCPAASSSPSSAPASPFLPPQSLQGPDTRPRHPTSPQPDECVLHCLS